MEEENVPDRDTCQNRILEFVSITQSNEAVAQEFLGENWWDLERAISAFYEALAKEESDNLDESVVEVLFGEGKSVTNEPPPRLQLLSWNVDSLDERNLKRRMAAVVKIVTQCEPDVIFFQELINETADYFERKLPEYKCIRGGNEGYFTMTLLRIFTIYYDSHKIVNYHNTTMGRNLILCRAHIGQRHFILGNTHLESTKEFEKERRQQIREAFGSVPSDLNNVTVIIGGDLNMRDAEVNEVPSAFVDVWESCGKQESVRWTWDTRRNTNRGFSTGPNGKFGPRARFDRIFIKPELGKVHPTHFGIVGAQRAPNTEMFPSDHWGILTRFQLIHK